MAASRRTRNTLAARKLRKGAETIRGIVSARGTLARGSPAAFAKMRRKAFGNSRHIANGKPSALQTEAAPGPQPLRTGARKSVPAIHPVDGSPSLFAHLSGGTLRVPFSRGPAPAPPQPLKRLAKLLCCSNPFGAVGDLGKLPFFRANLPFFTAILREFEIFFYIPEITVEK